MLMMSKTKTHWNLVIVVMLYNDCNNVRYNNDKNNNMIKKVIPIDVTLVGIMMDVNDEHWKKALLADVAYLLLGY